QRRPTTRRPDMSISPASINAFVAQHAEQFSSMISDEMKGAQDRATLMKDVAGLSASLQACAGTKDWKGANATIAAFIKDHPDVPLPADFSEIYGQTAAWQEGKMCDSMGGCLPPSDGHANVWGVHQGGDIDQAQAQAHMEGFIGKMNAWKDKI